MPTIINNGSTHISIKTISACDCNPGTFNLILPIGSQPSENDWDMISIEIKNPIRDFNVLVVSDTSAYDEDCALLNSNTLSVLQGWTIYHIDVTSCILLGTTEIESLCPNYNLFRVQDGYIVFGEIDVTMLDSNFNFMWTFAGNDVFCPMDNELKPIEICNDRIKLFDFKGDYYELNYRGVLLTHHKKQK